MTLKELTAAYAKGELAKAQYIEEMHGFHRRLYEYADILPETDIRAIEITDGRVVMTTRQSGVRLICDPEDRRIAPIEILNFGAYEPTEFATVLALLKDGDTVLDIGANIGFYAISVAKRFPGTTVHAFEPIPRTFAYLEQHISLNQTSNVIPHQFGLSDREADIPFFYYPEGSVNASAADLSGRDNVLEVVCKVKRLDDYARAENLRVDFIKCDVEGAELMVFRGGMETLARDRPVIFTEMLRKWSAKFNYHPNDIITALGALGYRCYIMRGGKLTRFLEMESSTVETNFFFLHQEAHAARLDGLGVTEDG